MTQLLRDWHSGDSEADAALAAAVYAELRRLAASRMSHERQDHTLQPTALVNEMWLRLVDRRTEWQNRAHFFGVAAMTMRRILVDHARRRDAAKRMDGGVRVVLDDVLDTLQGPLPDERLLALDEALTRLEALDPRQARVVELRFFAGLPIEDVAATLDVSPGTVKREWAAARAWLYDALQGGLGA